MVSTKNITAPVKAPNNLSKIDWLNVLEINPIKATLPIVKKIVEWRPIIKSVKNSASITMGINLIPNIAGI